NFHRVDRIARQRSVDHGLLKSFLYRRNELAGNYTTHDVIHKFQTFFTIITRPDLKHDVRKLTTATGLLLVYVLVLHGSGERFLVGNLGRTLVDLYLELTPQPVDDDLQVKLTHTAKYGLPRFLVGVHPQREVFLHKLGDSHPQLGVVGLLLWLDAVTANVIGRYHRLHHNCTLFVAMGGAGLNILDSYAGAGISGMQPLDLILL